MHALRRLAAFHICLFLPLAFFLPVLLVRLPCQGDVIENVHGTHQRMDGWRGGQEEGGRKEEASVHDQTSVSYWSASLAFSDLLLWPKRKGE